MENIHTGYFDLTMLLTQNDLNIYSVAAASRNLTAGDYYDMLSELLDNASMFSNDLLKLVIRDGDQSTYKNLAAMFAMLKNLGYEKHAIDFDGMLDSYDRGNSRLTSAYAKRIMDGFDSLVSRIMAARVFELPEVSDADPYRTSLKDWIGEDKKEAPVGKPVILAVDDSPVILKSVSSLLSDEYKVYMLAKSVLLEKTLSQITPDLFLLDYNMPIINGFDLIPIIRGFEEHSDTPIIFLTSEGTIDNISGAVMLGACDFIVKPVQPELLKERISRHLAKRSEIRNVS